jgi:hypothetical protein
MKSRIACTKKTHNDELSQALAVLIACTRSRSRPFSLTEVAHWVDVAVKQLGSISSVASKIGLSSKMLQQFLSVKKLAHEVQALFALRQIDSVDSAAHLAKLSKADQKVVAKALASNEIDTMDVRGIVDLHRSGDVSKISNIIKRVRESKTVREYVIEFVIRGNMTSDDILRQLTKHIPQPGIVRLEVDGAIGRLVLNRKGKEALTAKAKESQITLKRIIPEILQS